MTNKKDYFAAKGILKEKMTLCSKNEFSFEHFVMKGKALADMERQAQSLTEFITKSYGIRFEVIALDFVKDEFGESFFVGCNGFTICEYERIARIQMMSIEEAENRKIENKEV